MENTKLDPHIFFRNVLCIRKLHGVLGCELSYRRDLKVRNIFSVTLVYFMKYKNGP